MEFSKSVRKVCARQQCHPQILFLIAVLCTILQTLKLDSLFMVIRTVFVEFLISACIPFNWQELSQPFEGDHIMLGSDCLRAKSKLYKKLEAPSDVAIFESLYVGDTEITNMKAPKGE